MHARRGVRRVSEARHAQGKGDGYHGVEGAVEGAPEGEDVVAGLPELEDLIADEGEREEVEEHLCAVESAARVHRVDGEGVQAQVHDGQEEARHVLVDGSAHAVRVHVHDEAAVIAALVVDEDVGVVLVLAEPALPEVLEALLVTRRADYAQSVEVDGLFDGVGGVCRGAVDDHREAVEEHAVEKVRDVVFILDAAECQ